MQPEPTPTHVSPEEAERQRRRYVQRAWYQRNKEVAKAHQRDRNKATHEASLARREASPDKPVYEGYFPRQYRHLIDPIIHTSIKLARVRGLTKLKGHVEGKALFGALTNDMYEMLTEEALRFSP